MLQNTMNMKSFIYIIGCLSPHENNFEESLLTLQYMEKLTKQPQKAQDKFRKGSQDINDNNLS